MAGEICVRFLGPAVCAACWLGLAAPVQAANLQITSAYICNEGGIAVTPHAGERFWIRVAYNYQYPVCTHYVIRRTVDSQTIDAPPINWGCGYSGTTSWVQVWGTWLFTEPGMKTATVTLDASGAISETNENDNSLTFYFQVLPQLELPTRLSWPIAGRVGVDISACTFFDVGPVNVVENFLCRDWAYEGHAGNDFGHEFEAMDIGPVAVFAALPGVVTYTADGYYDRRTDCDHADPACGNQITIGHDDDLETVYCHLQAGSLLVGVGEQVAAGEQIATSGSSGCSSGPHLHFETRHNGFPFDPLAGPCNPTPLVTFSRQRELATQVRPGTYISAVCEGGQPPAQYYFYPEDTLVTINSDIMYLQQGQTLEWQFVQNGQVFATVPSGPFGNAICGGSWRWCFFRPAGTGPGAVRILVDGDLLWEQPYLAVPSGFVPPANVAPTAPVVAFEYAPQEGEVTWASITQRSFNADYDPVVYHYEWFVDDSPVREHTTIALTDALAAPHAVLCSTVRCRVTPMDDEATGESVEITSPFAPPDSSHPLGDPETPSLGFGTKNRYMSFVGGDSGHQLAVRVTFTTMPGYAYAEGRMMWVQEPFLVTEVSGSSAPTPPPTFWAAKLGCQPHYTDWSAYGVIDVYDDAIIPGAVFGVQVIGATCDTADEGGYSDPLSITMSRIGDAVGNCGVTPCSPPQGVVDFVDISAVADKFRNLPTAARKARADLINSDIAQPLPDRKVDFVDISYCVDAFRGAAAGPVGPPPTDPCQ